MEVVLQPIASKLDNNTLHLLAKDISKEFENKATVSVGTAVDLQEDPQFQPAFDTDRNRWNSPKLLDWFIHKFRPNKNIKILVITDVDAYSDDLNFANIELDNVFLHAISNKLFEVVIK